CTIERVVGKAVGPSNDGTVTVTTEPVYNGPCRFQQGAAPWAGPATVGQAGIGLSAQELQLPVAGSEGVAKDDIVTCTSAAHDAELVGRRWTVQGSHHASHKTMRRLPLSEVLG
ncbi:MAG: DUF6093 family protein, partial [Micromonosporaceae bacterium]